MTVVLVVVLLGVAGFVLTHHAVQADRHASASRRAEIDAQRIRGLLQRASGLAVGLGSALEGERAPDRNRFATLEGSAAATVGLTSAMWVERVTAGGRRAYERRIGAPITRLFGTRPAPPARAYLPATFVTGLPFHRGADVSGLPALADTLRNPASIFAGTATPVQTIAGRRGFFVVQGARFGRGPGSRGFLVLFVPTGWLRLSLNEDPTQMLVALDGRRLAGSLRAKPDARQSFEGLTRRWLVGVARENAAGVQALLPWLALVWPAVTALLAYLVGRGMLRRRRAEREVDDVFDLSLDILCIVGVDGYLKRVNPAFEHTLGFGADELRSRPLLEFVHPADRDATAASIASLWKGHETERFESRFVRSDGAFRWLQWNTRGLPERGLLYAAARDVTDTRVLVDEQAALRRVATLVAQGPDAGDLFNAVAVEVGQLLGADATRLLRHDEQGVDAVVAVHGAADAEMGVSTRSEVDGGDVWGQLAQRAGVMYGGQPSAPTTEAGPALGIGAAVAAPIVVHGRPWGVIVAAWRSPEMVGSDTQTRMAQFTELVATAIANAESREELAASRRRIVATADETRRRIERDLHDGVQQRQVQTIFALKLVQQSLVDGAGDVPELLEQALETAESANDELRELARGIHPAILSDGGLGPALTTIARRSPIPTTVELRTDARMPDHTEVAAFYVVTEALTNAAKHSKASAVQVSVDRVDGVLRLSISDDGVGGADPTGGSGLVGLHDRVEAAGGILTVQSRPGEGTHLTVELPVPRS